MAIAFHRMKSRNDLADAEEKIEAQAPAGRDLPGRRLARRLALPHVFSRVVRYSRSLNAQLDRS
jgi:hypothetical protein